MKNKKDGSLGFTLIGFLLFFLTIAVTSSAAVIVYSVVNKNTNGNMVAIVFSFFATTLIGAIIYTIIDVFRRKTMIEKPVKMILQATQKIASGDFSVKLLPLHEYAKYDEYDVIFENINTMTAELSKNELLKNDFISNVSHEIKTPLSIIQNYAKALQNENVSKEKRKEYLSGLISQTKRLSELIKNILQLNKLENQEIVPELQKINLAELLRVTTLEFESLLEKKQISLECDIDEISLTTSASLLEIAINNLISNAIKFTEPGGKITISLKENKNLVIVKIKDTGCGISKEVGEHIFEKFYQGDTSHSTHGNGLGLALVKKVIDIIGGEISVKSKVGEGSTFKLKFKKD